MFIFFSFQVCNWAINLWCQTEPHQLLRIKTNCNWAATFFMHFPCLRPLSILKGIQLRKCKLQLKTQQKREKKRNYEKSSFTLRLLKTQTKSHKFSLEIVRSRFVTRNTAECTVDGKLRKCVVTEQKYSLQMPSTSEKRRRKKNSNSANRQAKWKELANGTASTTFVKQQQQ